MHKEFPSLAFGLLLSTSVTAHPEADVAWLIFPQVRPSAAVEVKASRPNSHERVWRLISADRKILAEMPQPSIPAGYGINYGECKIDGVLRHDILAFVKHRQNLEWSRNVRRLWQADPVAGKFRPVTSSNVECRNEGYGV